MSAITDIQWTDRTWNPVRGCSVISPGCVNCYAMKQAHRFSGAGKPYEGLTKQTKAGPQWTGIVRPVESALLEPLSWRKPARVFVNSMSDLFHEDVLDAFIDLVFGVMALVPRHTFQILTKRADRMRAYLSVDRDWMNDLHRYMSAASDGSDVALELPVGGSFPRFPVGWPLPNVWLGVSVENQHFADERIPLLLETPAAVRFISAEPLLESIELMRGDSRRGIRDWLHSGEREVSQTRSVWITGLDWVIVGGESGAGARPFDLAWARSIVQQCKSADVPIFVKQLGANRQWSLYDDGVAPELIKDRKGGDISEWPEDLRVREFPVVCEVVA